MIDSTSACQGHRRGERQLARRAAWLLATLTALAGPCRADGASASNVFGDPFGTVTAGMPGCPEPSGPQWTPDEARQEAHARAERGTSCHLSGRCRLPNAYLYDTEIFPSAVRVLQQDPRLRDTSLWLAAQRRWVLVYGCVRTADQGQAIESALARIEDVEVVVPQWMVGVSGRPPYRTRDLKENP